MSYYLMVLFLQLGVNGLQQQNQQYRSRRSHFLKSFGCVEKRNITVVMDSVYNDYEELFNSLEDPCHILFYFAFNESRFLSWKYGEGTNLGQIRSTTAKII